MIIQKWKNLLQKTIGLDIDKLIIALDIIQHYDDDNNDKNKIDTQSVITAVIRHY